MKKFDLQFFAEGDPTPGTDSTPQEGGKTFTQEEVNRIVSERLSKEKGKINAEREATYTKKEQELNTRELKLKARETLSEKSLPSELLDVLNCSSEEELLRCIDILEQTYSKNQKQGEPQAPQTGFIPIIGGHGGNNSRVSIIDPIKEAMGLNRKD